MQDCHNIPRTHGFDPLLCNEPRILILGTLPGGESLTHRQYYYSNSNRIWKVLCQLTGENMPVDYQEKKALLARHHIVLSDYYESAIRPDSSNDKDIRDKEEICSNLTYALEETLASTEYYELQNSTRVKVALERGTEIPADAYLYGYISDYQVTDEIQNQKQLQSLEEEIPIYRRHVKGRIV